MRATRDREEADRRKLAQRKDLVEYRLLAKEAADETNRVAYEGALQGRKKDEAENERSSIRAAALRLVRPEVRPYPLDEQYLLKRIRQAATHFNPSDEQLKECCDKLVFEKHLERCTVEHTVSNGLEGSDRRTTFYARSFFPWDHFKKYNVDTIQTEARKMREEDEVVEAARFKAEQERIAREAEEKRLAEIRAKQEEEERKQRAKERKEALAKKMEEQAAAERKAAADAKAQKQIDDMSEYPPPCSSLTHCCL